MKLSSLKIDSAKVEQGAWIGDLPDMGNLKLHVRGIGNVDYRKLSARLYQALPRAMRNDPDEQDRVMLRLLVETLLLGWDGLEDERGTPIPYSREKAEDFLSDPDLRPFRDAVVQAATIVADREQADERADLGN